MGSIALIRQTFADANWYRENKDKSFSKSETLLIEFNSALAALANIENEQIIFDYC
ncbi:Secreted enzyme, contains two amidohydrolase related domains [Shewanella benthica KT99]|uniref:Secreted enzyme, contains two amidohydrolase related domains n=1 Tax=Shewanella benthica KT99 TaxID=314608 RepID=A9D8T8_9GAMM|nr:Secreted enzyme, contains two amidohydrolase related domains [Shewanella benthica KT99]